MRFLSLLFAILLLSSCRREVTVDGVVKIHDTSSDKYGKIYYHTIVECSDGIIRDETGLWLYSQPIGAKVKIKVFVID